MERPTHSILSKGKGSQRNSRGETLGAASSELRRHRPAELAHRLTGARRAFPGRRCAWTTIRLSRGRHGRGTCSGTSSGSPRRQLSRPQLSRATVGARRLGFSLDMRLTLSVAACYVIVGRPTPCVRHTERGATDTQSENVASFTNHARTEFSRQTLGFAPRTRGCGVLTQACIHTSAPWCKAAEPEPTRRRRQRQAAPRRP